MPYPWSSDGQFHFHSRTFVPVHCTEAVLLLELVGCEVFGLDQNVVVGLVDAQGL